MILIENAEVTGWKPAIRGMRNPMNSWEKSDSEFVCGDDGYDILGNSHPTMEDDGTFTLGPADHDLMLRLVKAGPVDAKFRRMIVVHMDITAPLYWWKEFDTYKVGTVANSCSTMHKIADKEFTLEDFSHEHLVNEPLLEKSPGVPELLNMQAVGMLEITIGVLNAARHNYIRTKDKKYWWQMIQLLPSSYNQKRTVMLNYEVLANIYQHRRNHKLDEWRVFCAWIEMLPYSDIITCSKQQNQPEATFITEHDKLVLSAYTDDLMCDFNDYHKFIEETLARPVFTHELAFEDIHKELRKKLKPEFLRIIGKGEA